MTRKCKIFRPKSKVDVANFTLIEMLAVMAIMTILLYTAMPAFEALTKGSGVDIAGRSIAGKLKAARAYAIAKRKYVAVVFPDSAMPDKYLYSSYRACVVDKNGSNYNFSYWINGEKWNFTPTGTSIIQIDTTYGYSAPSGISATTINNVDYSDILGHSSGTDTANMNGIVFKPNGAAVGTADLCLTIGEGKYSGGTLVTSNTSNVVNLTIGTFTGRITFEEQ